MKLNPIVAHLRKVCPSFAGRVTGGIDWDAVVESAQLALPAAYVIATADAATPSKAQNRVIQEITDQFNVVIVLDTSDERGQEDNEILHDLRAELWLALVGFTPAAEYTPIEYGKGALLHISRARVVYQFTFFSEFQLGRNSPDQPAETWHERELDGLPKLEGLDINYDVINSHGGPDGRIEFHTREDLPQ